MEHTIHGLIKKRGEIAGQHKAAQIAADAIRDDLDAIDRALVLCGYTDAPNVTALQGFFKFAKSRGTKPGEVLDLPCLRKPCDDDERSARLASSEDDMEDKSFVLVV